MKREPSGIDPETAPAPPASPSWTPAEYQRWDHDLRNLLYLIVSFARLLRSGEPGPLSGRQQEMLGHVLDCAEQIRGLIDEAARRAPVDGEKAPVQPSEPGDERR